MSKQFSGPVAAVVLSLVVATVADSNYWLYVMAIAVTFAILSVGLNLVMGYTGLVSVAHGAFFGLGAYGFVLCSERGLHPVLAAVVGILVAGVGGVLLGSLTLRLSGHYFAISSLAFAVVVMLVLDRWADLTHGARGLTKVPEMPAWEAGGLRIDLAMPSHALVAVTVILALCQIGVAALVRSPFGRALTAIRASELLAASFGVALVRTKLIGLVLSAGIAGMAGILYVLQVRFFVPADAGFTVGFYAVMYVAVGGMGTIWGPVVGAIVLRVAPEYLRTFDELRMLILGIVLILMIKFAPRGLVGMASAAWRRVRRRDVTATADVSVAAGGRPS